MVLGLRLYETPSEAQACVAEEGTLGNFHATEGHPPVPDTVFKDGTGKDLTLADFKGRGVVLNFWATWCAPCVKEMPQLDRLKGLVAGNGIDVLTVSEDRKGISVVKPFYETNKLYDLAIHIDPGGKLLRAFKGRGLPTTILIDKHGREAGRVTGVAEYDTAEAIDFIRGCLGS